MINPLAWLGGKATPKDIAASAARAQRHRATKPRRNAQRFADDGYCPAGYFHTGRCRHR